ncbi:aromatic acid exporter family protein [Paenibacillus tarimensis]|uniref:aromatic acid exporter family protein n=1 Tax=Paenibacillus tarimensis TaxID=416012 RepID=UPI001F3504B9|nr:aromatic acid exporter family protein [Paenibacillus tarimensis]MCF2943408.1 aromatic acid exporter family protein [Paenibacillus tarimensis]
MTIGARVLKTGVAVALAIFVSGLFHFPSPIIAAVAAIFTIQPSIYRSWKQVLDQVQSNVLGAIIALASVQVLGSTPISVGLVCIAVILLNIKLKMESAIGLTLVTVVAVMEANSEGWDYALGRFLMVMAGMGCAFLVNVLLFPPRPKKQFFDQIREAYGQLSLLLRTAISNEIKEQVHKEEKDKLHGTLRKLDERYALFEEERSVRPESKLDRARQLLLSKQMIKALRKGADLLDAVEEHYFSAPGAEEWSLRFDERLEELTKYHEHILLKSEGKMKTGAQIEPEEGREGSFVSELTHYVSANPDGHKRLIFVATALFEYDYQLRRLDKLVNQIEERKEQ